MSNAHCNLERGVSSVQDKATEATRSIDEQSGCLKLLEEGSNWTVQMDGVLICKNTTVEQIGWYRASNPFALVSR